MIRRGALFVAAHPQGPPVGFMLFVGSAICSLTSIASLESSKPYTRNSQDQRWNNIGLPAGVEFTFVRQAAHKSFFSRGKGERRP